MGQKHLKARKRRMSLIDINKLAEEYVFVEPQLEVISIIEYHYLSRKG